MKACAAVFILLAAGSAFAQQSGGDLKIIDDFFATKLSASGCDKATWELMHQTMRAQAQKQALPPSSADEDWARVHQIDKCLDIAADADMNLMKALNKFAIDNSKALASLDPSRPDANVLPRVLSDIDSNTNKTLMFLDWHMTLQLVSEWGHLCATMHINHAAEANYQALVDRYNALVGRFNFVVSQPRPTNQPSSQEPVAPLHCEARTMTWGMMGRTTLDCR